MTKKEQPLQLTGKMMMTLMSCGMLLGGIQGAQQLVHASDVASSSISKIASSKPATSQSSTTKVQNTTQVGMQQIFGKANAQGEVALNHGWKAMIAHRSDFSQDKQLLKTLDDELYTQSVKHEFNGTQIPQNSKVTIHVQVPNGSPLKSLSFEVANQNEFDQMMTNLMANGYRPSITMQDGVPYLLLHTPTIAVNIINQDGKVLATQCITNMAANDQQATDLMQMIGRQNGKTMIAGVKLSLADTFGNSQIAYRHDGKMYQAPYVTDNFGKNGIVFGGTASMLQAKDQTDLFKALYLQHYTVTVQEPQAQKTNTTVPTQSGSASSSSASSTSNDSGKVTVVPKKDAISSSSSSVTSSSESSAKSTVSSSESSQSSSIKHEASSSAKSDNSAKTESSTVTSHSQSKAPAVSSSAKSEQASSALKAEPVLGNPQQSSTSSTTEQHDQQGNVLGNESAQSASSSGHDMIGNPPKDQATPAKAGVGNPQATTGKTDQQKGAVATPVNNQGQAQGKTNDQGKALQGQTNQDHSKTKDGAQAPTMPQGESGSGQADSSTSSGQASSQPSSQSSSQKSDMPQTGEVIARHPWISATIAAAIIGGGAGLIWYANKEQHRKEHK